MDRGRNEMDLTYDKKKWIGIVLLLVFAILSFSAGAKYASDPEHHKATIAALDEKKGTVLELTVAATATSALNHADSRVMWEHRLQKRLRI